MPVYLSQWIYKDTAFHQMIKDQQNREEVVRDAVKAFEGQLLSFFFCLGEYDGMCISEFADQETALACLYTILGAGAIQRLRTTVLVTQEEASRSIQKAREVAGNA